MKRTKAESDLPLPQPMELAKLAAMLAPESKPTEALENAMRFYVEAVLFSCELPSTVEELVRRFGSRERIRALLVSPLKQSIEAVWQDTLELDPSKGDDTVRQFLAESGLALKTGRAVLKNIQRFQRDLEASRRRPIRMAGEATAEMKFRIPDEGKPDLIAACKKRTPNGKTVYAIPRHLLGRLVESAKVRRSATKRKAWRTRQSKSSV